jgi:hypothetical protein
MIFRAGPSDWLISLLLRLDLGCDLCSSIEQALEISRFAPLSLVPQLQFILAMQ